MLAGAVRGSGQMLLASLALVGTAGVHLLLCPLLVFGLGSWPGLGVAGAATSTLISNALAGSLLAWQLLRGQGPVRLRPAAWRPQPDALRALLRVGLPAMLSPVLSNASITITTRFIAALGTTALAGYGLAERLEYIIVPIAFGFGTALTTLVATNLGAGQRERALRATWVGSALVAAITGAIGGSAALWPQQWMQLLTGNAAVIAFGADYLRMVGPFYGLFGLGLALFFASQGAGRLAEGVRSAGVRRAAAPAAAPAVPATAACGARPAPARCRRPRRRSAPARPSRPWPGCAQSPRRAPRDAAAVNWPALAGARC